MAALKIAFFVEGSEAPAVRRSADAFQELWIEALPLALNLERPERVVPISKKHLIAMDRSLPRMSGAGERLDQLMARELSRRSFDVAAVVWDLLPVWCPPQKACRWDETKALYEGISRSDVLGDAWTRAAAARLSELNSRPRPSMRVGPPELQPHAVVGVCMEPVFEALLLGDEGLVRKGLGVRNRAVRGWPRPWAIDASRRCDLDLLGPALEACRRAKPRPPIYTKIPPSMRTHKNEWALHLLRFLAEERTPQLARHPISRRLIELFGVRAKKQ